MIGLISGTNGVTGTALTREQRKSVYKEAACKGMPTIYWFAEKNAKYTVEERRVMKKTALATCARCHVRLECLLLSFDYPHEEGIWAGLSADKRARLRRALQRRRLRQRASS